jgi:effector-binding domain-containing protein
MLDAPQIITTEPQLVAAIHLCVPWAKMREVMGPGLAELRSTVAEQGIAATGPWFNHHLRMPTDTFDFRISLPVGKPVTPKGRVEAHELLATTVARTTYHGPYDGLAKAWSEFTTWIAANDHRTGSEFWECYVSGPESGADPSSWRTELNWPLIAVKGG